METKKTFEHTIGDAFSAVDAQQMFAEVKGQQPGGLQAQGQMGQGLQMPGKDGRPGGKP